MSKVPEWIHQRLGALLLSLGVAGGGAGLYVAEAQHQEAQRDEFVQAVAADASTSLAVKIAMVMGRYYESSGKHIGTPYVDKVGKGQPLTVCNGVTGAGVIAGKLYTPAECYALEKAFYLAAERAAPRYLTHWSTYDPFIQATFLDFIFNKGEGNFSTSTMRKLANAGDIVGSCKQNPRWNRGTVNGVSVVLAGLGIRASANEEICLSWRVNQ